MNEQASNSLQDSLDDTQKIHSTSEAQLKLSKAILKKHREGAPSFIVGDIVKNKIGSRTKWEVESNLGGGYYRIKVGHASMIAHAYALTLLKSPSKEVKHA